jgi:tetratricopeptide (TPR) repeat protein
MRRLKAITLFCYFIAVFASVIFPQSPKEYYENAIQHLQNQEYDEAIESIQAVLDTGLEIPQLYNLLGIAHLQKTNETETAIYYFERAIKLDPTFSDAYANIGSAYASLGEEPELALENFKKAIKIDPNQAKSMIGAGWIYLTETHNPRKAKEMFERAVRIEPYHQNALYGLGIAYVILEKPELAIKPISILRSLNRFDLAASIEERMRQDKTSERDGPSSI